jgi:hypothetical protein
MATPVPMEHFPYCTNRIDHREDRGLARITRGSAPPCRRVTPATTTTLRVNPRGRQQPLHALWGRGQQRQAPAEML